jgi:hypothetical protein
VFGLSGRPEDVVMDSEVKMADDSPTTGGHHPKANVPWLRRPERIRDAGIVMIAFAVMNLTRNFPDLIQRGAGAPLLFLGIVILVQICIGLVTLYRKLWALLAGLVLQFVGIVSYVFTIVRLNADVSELLSVLFPLIPFLAYVVALFAYYHSGNMNGTRGAEEGRTIG